MPILLSSACLLSVPITSLHLSCQFGQPSPLLMRVCTCCSHRFESEEFKQKAEETQDFRERIVEVRRHKASVGILEGGGNKCKRRGASQLAQQLRRSGKQGDVEEGTLAALEHSRMIAPFIAIQPSVMT